MEVFVYDAIITPRGKGRKNGALASTKPIDLLAGLFHEITKRVPFDPNCLDDVVIGCVTAVGEQGANIAKIASLYAGLGESVPGATVNRFCASGLDALNMGFAKIASSMASAVLVGGVESMSRVPMLADQGAWFTDPIVAEKTGFIHMAFAADLLANRYGLTRDVLDRYALQSHQRATIARNQGYHHRSIVPVKRSDGEVQLTHDECVRDNLTETALSQLQLLFSDANDSERQRFMRVIQARYPGIKEIEHRHTVGTSPAIADAASLVLLGNAEFGKRFSLTPRARVVSFADIASDPVQMLEGNPVAVTKALSVAGLRVESIDFFEVNESFAAVPLHFCSTMHIDQHSLNMWGGAIASGHPLGATGCILVGNVIDQLHTYNKRYGAVSICAGAGLATATILERA